MVESTRIGPPRVIQKGLRQRLLCPSCETKFSAYETYAAPIVRSLAGLPMHSSGLALKPLHVDYPKFKLFEMSLLWRAAVSGHPLFAGVTLGKAEPRLRDMLANGRPGRRNNFGCAIAIVPNTMHLHGIIGPAVRTLVRGFHCVRFQIGELFWHFFLSDFPKGHSMPKMFLSEDGRLIVLLPHWHERDIVSDIARALRRQAGVA